jgi:dTDP-4-amino-4,6-dideoxygalactose transaminase
MNEVQAAFGLLQLRYLEDGKQKRRAVDRRYRTELAGLPGIRCLPEPADTDVNYSYFPILVGPEHASSRDALYERLREHGIFARRYFFPLVSEMPMYRGLPSAAAENLPVASRVAQQVLCLPIHADLSVPDQERVIQLIKG